MRIAKRSGRARGVQPVGINQRMSLGRDDLDVLHADAPQLASHVIRRPLDIGFVLRQGADAGNAQQVFQFIQKTLLVLAGKSDGGRSQGRSFHKTSESIPENPGTLRTFACCCTCYVWRYTIAELMIKTFRSKDTERLHQRERVLRFRPFERVAQRKLRQLDAAVNLADLASPPGNRLEALRGERAGQHSTRINDQWRICFRWKDGNAYEVETSEYQ